jgi:hypothetical protein
MQRSLRVKLSGRIPADSSQQVNFVARRVPSGWLDRWEEKTVSFPKFHVIGTNRDKGAIAVQVRDDLEVQPGPLTGLTALGNREKQENGLGGVDTQLAYYFDNTDYVATVTVTRSKPLLTARSQSFFRVQEGSIATYYELTFQLQRSRLDEVEFSLPVTTPVSLEIEGLDGVIVKQSSSRVDGTRRYWTVLLSKRHDGDISLGVRTELPLGEIEVDSPVTKPLPVVRAEAVSYQSGVFSVEGSIDLEITIDTKARVVDVGELIGIDYVVGDSLLGGYGFVGQVPDVAITILRHPEHSIPLILVQRARIVTFLAAEGRSQTDARFTLLTQSAYLQLKLPEESRLWAILVDNYPVRPQKRGERILVSLASQPAAQLRDLRIVYSTPFDPVSFSGTVSAKAPLIYEGTSSGLKGELPVNVAELLWDVVLPPNYKMSRLRGSLVQIDHQQPRIGDRVDDVRDLFATMIEARREMSQSWKIAYTPQSTRSGRADFEGDGLAYSQESAGSEADYDMPMSDDFKSSAITDGRKSRDFGDSAGDMADAESAPESAEPMGAGGESAGEQEAPTSPMEPQAAIPGPDSSAAPQPAEGPPTTGPGPGQFATASERAYIDGKEDKDQLWELEGIRSLDVDLVANLDSVDESRVVKMRSLGSDASWRLTLVSHQRLAALGLLLGLVVTLVGVMLCGSSWRIRFRYIVGLLVVSVVLPALGLFSSLQVAWDLIFLLGLLLIPFYLIAPLLWWAACTLWKRLSRRPAVTACWLGLSLLLGSSLAAQAPATADTPVKVTVPPNAIIIPYDPEKPAEAADSDRVLIPYDRYAALWKRAYPNRPLLHELLPATHALAGSHFTATLANGDSLLLTGYLDIDVFTDEEVAVPISLQGGVLRTATMNAAPARLQVLVAAAGQQQDVQVQQAANIQQQVNVPLAPPPPPTFNLLLKGKGRQRLEMTLAMSITRQGGWRIVNGVLPVSAASSVALKLSAAKTEVRWSGATDRGEYVSVGNNETIHLSADPGGRLQLRWRPTVAESMVDRSLTARSNTIVDVQEEAVHVVWDVRLQFRRGQRDIFQFLLPTTFQVEDVTGGNVRGWDVITEMGQQLVNVELLEAARDQVQMQLHLVRHGAVGRAGLQQFEVPVIAVPDAMLHQGQVAIRRTPLINLRVVSAEAVTRDDLSAELAKLFQARGNARISPLGLQPYQTYSFSATPFRIQLEAEMVKKETNAFLQTLLRLVEQDVTLESRIRIMPSRLAVHRVDIQVPPGLEIIEVEAPGLVDWSRHDRTVDDELQDVLTVLLGSGHRQPFDVILRGLLDDHIVDGSAELPRLRVLGTLRQQGQLVLQTDPSFDVEILQLDNCQQQSIETVKGWFQAGQRSHAQVISHRDENYSGSVRLVRRKSIIHGSTVTNIRVTDRAIEETILLDFFVSEAGIDEIVFQLPAELRDARIAVPMLRQIEITPIDADDDQSDVRVRIQLQDEVIGQIQVLVENDRVLHDQDLDETNLQRAPIPLLETGQTDNRWVTIDSSGDEVTVKTSEGLDSLPPQSPAFRSLANKMGAVMGKVFIVSGTTSPLLEYQILQHDVKPLTTAQVSLSEVTVVMDEQGSYRARQIYEMDNRKEQFLDVRLPPAAKLWIVQVAGQPVKPRQVPGEPGDRAIRIPIRRLAEGDAEFKVKLIYGGEVPELGHWGEVKFPFMEMISEVQIGKTQVSLYLPETHRWYNFDGTTEQVQSHDELMVEQYKEQLAKNKQQVQSMKGGTDVFAKFRMMKNLKEQQYKYESAFREQQVQGEDNDIGRVLSANIEANSRLQEQVEGQLKDLDEEEEFRSLGNRSRWNEGFERQDNYYSRNAIQQLGQNFDIGERDMKQSAGRALFQDGWFNHNGLQVTPQPQAAAGKNRIDMNDPAKAGKPSRPMAKRPMATPMNRKPSDPTLDTPAQHGGQPKKKEDVQRRQSQKELYQNKLNSDLSNLESNVQNQRELDRLSSMGFVPSGDSRPASGTASGEQASGSSTGQMGGGMGGGGRLGGMLGGGGGFGIDQRSANLTLAEGIDSSGIVMAGTEIQGRASLIGFEIPTGGKPFFFKTVGGKIEINARHVDESLAETGTRFGWLAGSLIGLLVLVQFGGPLARHRVAGKLLAGLLFLYSVILMVSSLVPELGLLLMLVSIAWVFWLYFGQDRQPVTTDVAD